MSLGAAREAIPFPWMQQKRKTQSVVAALRRKVTRLRPLFIVACWAAIGTGMLLWGVGTIRAAYVQDGANTSKIPQQAAPNRASNSMVASTSASCRNSKTESTQIFASCPTFTQDYSSQKSGKVSSQIYNVTTGKPEANGEAQLYTANAQNLRVQDGKLVLQALNDPQQGFSYTSARIDTKGKEDFLYGKLVVRATLPTGIGTWPAIWMLPSQSKYAALSPATDTNRYLNDGEIDIAESVGTEPHDVYGIAHSLAHPENGPNRGYYNVINLPDNDTVPHDYELDWTPTNMTFKVDGKAFFSISKQPGADYRSWPYDQPFYLVLNLAIGGSWGGAASAQFPPDGVDKHALPAALNIHSINYYPYIGH